MNLSASDLYPVVQDLTEAEYGCCSSELVFGSFRLEDLAHPSAVPLNSSPRNGIQNCYRLAPRPSTRNVVDRENSLIDNPKDLVNELNRVDKMTRRNQLHNRFEDIFVLTRQVSCDLQGFKVEVRSLSHLFR